MPLHALLFGGVSALAEIDALDHQALDAALQESGEGPLSFAAYRELAELPDGPDRMARVTDGDGATLFAAKQDRLRERLAEIGLTPRPGVAEVIDAASAEGVRLVLVSDLDPGTRDAVFAAFQRLETGTFDAVVRDWTEALEDLGDGAPDCMAIAADPETAKAAIAAGLPVTAYPDAAHRHRDFDGVSATTQALSPELLGISKPV